MRHRTVPPIAVSLFVVSLWFGAATSCRAPGGPAAPPFTEDPILTLGHGAFIGRDGKEFTPDADFIRRAQEFYLAALPAENGVGEAEIRSLSREVQSQVEDEILANALVVDWLAERVRPEGRAHLTMVNNALRWHYYLNILKKKPPTGAEWTKGIDPNAAAALAKKGLPTATLLKTSAGGAAYIKECRDAGVPVPAAMFSSEWQLKGIFDNEFISESSDAELWFYASSSPPGLCLALPRYPGNAACGSSDEACLLGIICLGTESNTACFFDNPRGKAFRRGVEVGIDQFVGGADLVANGQGICSDCHAGENPYVVHREKAPFATLPSLQPRGWPKPLVVAVWPQNPGPTNLLDAVPSTGRCDSCHRVGSAGRFPDVSTALPGYCGVILPTATGGPPKGTMPPSGFDATQFAAHRKALLDACLDPPTGGGVVVQTDLPDEPGFVSPPIVIDPLYQCAKQVAVRGAILDAKVELFINGRAVGSLIGSNPSQEEFKVPALVAGDSVTARQGLGGALSSFSAPVVVRDHTVDFPAGLPAPVIDPTLIHECADTIAVRHVPGAELTVFTNGGAPSSRPTSTDWSVGYPGKVPFAVGDSFTAEIELCGDLSPRAAPVTAVAAPPTIPGPALRPPRVYAGQRLVTIENIVHGARVRLEKVGLGALGDFGWPVPWYADFDVAVPPRGPLVAGDQLVVSQQLCLKGPPTTIPPAEECPQLPAPRIRHPQVGNTFVVVSESVPGARLHVYDSGGVELGDGSGTVITLRRALTGADILTVTQQLGNCMSRTGYRVSARNPQLAGRLAASLGS